MDDAHKEVATLANFKDRITYEELEKKFTYEEPALEGRMTI